MMPDHIYLAWPDRDLNPNSRVHWSKKAKKAKAAKDDASWATLISKVSVPQDYHGAIDLHITFHPKDKRRRDMDNLLSSMKSALDGVAMCLGVDDSRFRLHLEIGNVHEFPAVIIEIKHEEKK